MKTIPLSKGRFTIVDDEDFDFLTQWPWHATESKRKNGLSRWYAVRGSKENGSPVIMHRVIALRAGLPFSRYYDHKDANGLNNQRENIRPCTQSQNNGNARKRLGTTSKFKGVSWCSRDRRWRAHIRNGGKGRSLGTFKTEEAAAMAYKAAAESCFGEFARVNVQA